MATIIMVDWATAEKSERARHYAEMTLQRWGERQGGAAFVSVDNTFIMTDYAYDHKELGLLRHLLNCNKLSYRAIANIDPMEMGEMMFARAIINKTNKNHNKGA